MRIKRDIEGGSSVRGRWWGGGSGGGSTPRNFQWGNCSQFMRF